MDNQAGELDAVNALMSFILKSSQGKADMHEASRLLRSAMESHAACIQSDLEQYALGNQQAWGICDAVAEALGDDLDRDKGSAASVLRLKQRISELESALKKALH